MSVFDVTKDTTQKIEEIKWCVSAEWNIIQDEHYGISFRDISLGSEDYSLVFNKEQAENLIKELQKAIELGWLE